MYRLLAANLNRLRIYKPFWINLSIIVIIESLLTFMLVVQGEVPIDFALFIVLLVIGLITSFFIGLFYGIEYSDGTIRNKVIAGHKRITIYFASLITGIISISTLYFVSSILGSIIVITFSLNGNYDLSNFVLSSFIGWLSCISIISIFNMIGMLSSSKSKSSTTCIIVSFTLLIIGLICYSLSIQGVNSTIFGEAVQLLFDMNPFVQGIQIPSVDNFTVCKLGLYSLYIIFILNTVGIYIFNKKDLK